MTRTSPQISATRVLLNKVPEVTLFFWIIKILSTTVGETFADFLSGLGLGLQGTTAVMSVAFAAVLAWQFRTRRYVPAVYWLTVVLVSVVGTLITDNLTDALGVPLELSTAVFTVALAVTFAAWYRVERTLSIHSIVTRRREAFYWLAILFTLPLGTPAGARLSTGWPSCSPSPSAPPPATWSPSASASATGGRRCCSPCSSAPWRSVTWCSGPTRS